MYEVSTPLCSQTSVFDAITCIVYTFKQDVLEVTWTLLNVLIVLENGVFMNIFYRVLGIG